LKHAGFGIFHDGIDESRYARTTFGLQENEIYRNRSMVAVWFLYQTTSGKKSKHGMKFTNRSSQNQNSKGVLRFLDLFHILLFGESDFWRKRNVELHSPLHEDSKCCKVFAHHIIKI